MNRPELPPDLRRIGRIVLAAGISTLLLSQDQLRAAESIVVPRSEFEQMKREMAEMRQELNVLKAQRATAAPGTKSSADAPRGNTTGALALLNQRVDELASAVELGRPGDSKMHLGGEASATFAVGDEGESNFYADFSPVFLWHLNKDLLFEGKITFTLADHETDTDLRYAHLDWSLGDYVTLIGGKFLSPINAFREQFEPSWINKLPTSPLGTDYGILPKTNVGFQLRGAVPIAGQTKLNLALYVSNPPALENSEYSSRLDFEEYSVARDHKAIGGRAALEFCPGLEIGYGFQSSRAAVLGDNVYVRDQGLGAGLDYSYRDRNSIRTLQQSIDLQASFDALKGHWSLLAQYAWADSDSFSITHIYPSVVVDPGFYLSTTSFLSGTSFDQTVTQTIYVAPTVLPERRYITRFNNHRDGGYVQLSYRGTSFASDFLNRLEVIARADRQDSAFDGGADIDRLTLGLDYWIAPTTVLKTAYEFTHLENISAGKSDYGRFLLGVATGL